MEELRGRGNGGGIVYARVALVSDNEGRPTLDSSLVTEAFRVMRRGAEPLGVALVAPSAALALTLPLPPGLRLLAVIGEDAEEIPSGVSLPVITGVSGVLSAAAEGTLIAADPAKGVVWPDPSAEFLATLQTERERPRYLIGAANVAAATQAGREIAVWASVSYARELSDAVSEGADGISLEPFGDLLPSLWNDESEGDFLAAIAPLGGGDVTLYADFDEETLPTFFRLAARCRLRLAFSPDALPMSPGEFRAFLEERLDAARENAETGETLALPLLLARVHDLADPDLSAFDAVLLSSPDALADADLTALFSLPPLYVTLADDLYGLPSALGAGASGILVPAAAVSAAKDAIREI